MPRRVLLVVTSAGLQTLAFPPWGWSMLAWIALVPLLLALQGTTVRRAALLGGCWGTIAVWGIGYWVPVAFATYYEQPWWFGLSFALGASLLFAAPYAAAFAAAAAWCVPRLGATARPFLLATLWVASELLRARVLTGDPWILYGYTLIPFTPVIQVADLGGIYALSFVVVLGNAALAELWTARTLGLTAAARRLAPAALAIAAVVLYGAWRLGASWPTAPEVPLTIAQGNNDVGHQWREEFYGEGLRPYLTMSRDAARAHGSKLLVWPESAITFFLAREPAYRTLITGLLRDTGADLIVGGPHYEEPEPGGLPLYFNSAFFLTSDGTIASRYDKTHLLPFAEYFPLRTIELLRRRFEQVRFFTPGEVGRPLATSIGPVATVICFEGIFPEIVRAQTTAGARLLVNLSNDAWLGPGAGPEQHLSMVALRAVENRLWVVRATTTGISAVIDPWGRVVGRTRSDAADTLNARVVPMDVTTVYERVGDAFAYACLAVSILAVGLGAPSPSSTRANARQRAATERDGASAA